MKILIVDDSLVNLKMYAKLVSQHGLGDTQAFDSSGKALEWAESNEMDLAIVDYQMPDPDGLEFIRQFRRFNNKQFTPVLMVTADLTKEIKYAALDCGANDFLTKPIDSAEFMARVKNMLALGQSQKQLAETADWLADQVKAATVELANRERETIFKLSLTAERRDPQTGAHNARMARYCELLARGYGMPSDEADVILTAAPLHDIGKVAIPDSILEKPGKLTPQEISVMRAHPQLGFDILRGSSSRLLQTAAEIARYHHERYDGAGYPLGLSGDRIPLVGRISALSDVFDALTSVRPYKDAWSFQEAAEEINRSSGTHFDPRLVEVFNEMLPRFVNVRKEFPEIKSAQAARQKRYNGARAKAC